MSRGSNVDNNKRVHDIGRFTPNTITRGQNFKVTQNLQGATNHHQNHISSSLSLSVHSLKIWCKTVHPFSRNFVHKQKKNKKKQKKTKKTNIPSPLHNPLPIPSAWVIKRNLAQHLCFSFFYGNALGYKIFQVFFRGLKLSAEEH